MVVMIQNQHPVDLLPGYALSVLDAADENVVQAHIQSCMECQRELQQIMHELHDSAGDVPRTRVHRQLFAHINFDMDMREALREGARRTSLRWIWGAFLLISGSIVASLLMWSGMQQRELLANERAPTPVMTTNTEIVRFLAQPGLDSYELVPTTVAKAALMRMYYHEETAQTLFTATGLPARNTYVVWLMNDVSPQLVGSMMADDQGSAWLRAQIPTLCVRCNIIVTREGESTPNEPSSEWHFELIFR
ncbi:MAG: hypothetical protein RI985_1467 [Chloroflexota bacterium]